jgi:hypothetical protein
MLRADGEGTPYSLGKTQMALWGVLVMLSFCGVWILTGQMERIPNQTLTLLGISGGTGLLSIVIGSDKRSSNAALKALTKNADDLNNEIVALETKAQESAMTADEMKILEEKRTALAELRVQIAASKSAIKPKLTTGKWRIDIISDENGVSFHRLQVVLWTVILACVFIWSVAHTFSMPEFDSTLLVLLGISNGTYLGFKFQER